MICHNSCTNLKQIEIQQMTECQKVFRASKLEAKRQICAGGGMNERGNAGKLYISK